MKPNMLDTHTGRQYLSLKVLIPIFGLLIFLVIIVPLFYENFKAASFYTNLGFSTFGQKGSSYLSYPNNFSESWSNSSAFSDIFYRYAYNLHERILYFIHMIFKTNIKAEINQVGEKLFPLIVLTPFVIVFVIYLGSVWLPMFIKKRTNIWNYIASSSNIFFLAIVDAFLIAIIISNQNMPVTYGIKLKTIGVPYLLWIPVGLAAIATMLAIWYFIVNFWLGTTIKRVYRPETLKYKGNKADQNLKRRIKETLNPKVPG